MAFPDPSRGGANATRQREQRTLREEKILSARIAISLVSLLASAVFVTACGGGEETQGEQTQEQTASTEAQKETTKAGRETTAGSTKEVVLAIDGDQGIEFSGVCRVGDEENELSGQVPDSFSYDLKGQQLECEIRKESTGSGNLKVLLTGPGDRIEQQTGTPGGTINLVYSKNGVSSSTSSSGSSSSVNQVSSNTSSGSSSSVVSNSSSVSVNSG
jgi:hypothetical protein